MRFAPPPDKAQDPLLSFVGRGSVHYFLLGRGV
jgi:hypothetical protein